MGFPWGTARRYFAPTRIASRFYKEPSLILVRQMWQYKKVGVLRGFWVFGWSAVREPSTLGAP